MIKNKKIKKIKKIKNSEMKIYVKFLKPHPKRTTLHIYMLTLILL